MKTKFEISKNFLFLEMPLVLVYHVGKNFISISVQQIGIDRIYLLILTTDLACQNLSCILFYFLIVYSLTEMTHDLQQYSIIPDDRQTFLIDSH